MSGGVDELVSEDGNRVSFLQSKEPNSKILIFLPRSQDWPKRKEFYDRHSLSERNKSGRPQIPVESEITVKKQSLRDRAWDVLWWPEETVKLDVWYRKLGVVLLRMGMDWDRRGYRLDSMVSFKVNGTQGHKIHRPVSNYLYSMASHRVSGYFLCLCLIYLSKANHYKKSRKEYNWDPSSHYNIVWAITKDGKDAWAATQSK